MWYASGRITSALGDAIHRIALSLMIYARTGSALDVGLVLITTAVPALVIGPFVGPWLDRIPKKGLIVVSEIARAGLVVFIPFAPSLPILYSTTFVLYCFGFVSDTAQKTVGPALFPKESLMQVNATTQAGAQFMHVLGPIMGGWIVGSAGYEAAFLLDASSFLFSAITMMILPIKATAPVHQTTSFGQMLREGWQYVIYSRRILALTTVMVNALLVSGAFQVLLVVYVREVLSLSDQAYGVLISVVGVGMIFGALLMSAVRQVDLLYRLYGAIIVDAILIFALGAVLDYQVALVIFFLIGVVTSVANVTSTTVLQKEVRGEMLGRAFAFYKLSTTVASVVSMIIAPMLEALIGVRNVFLFGGVFVFTTTWIILLTLGRQQRGIVAG